MGSTLDETLPGAPLPQTMADTMAGPADAAAAVAVLDDRTTVTQEHVGRYTPGRRKTGERPLTLDEAELGRGGIGRVLIAYDEHLGREVAMKELLPSARALAAAPDPRLSLHTARFLREARVTGQLEHPNIIPVYELGRRDDGRLYYTMKVVRGRTLADAMSEAKTLDDRLRLLTHFADLCDAIAYAHSRGVIHRDIKPDNVMVGEFGETIVLDWGLAKSKDGKDLRGEDLSRELAQISNVDYAKTADGTLLGTPLYMSPEQASGRLDDVDEQSDVWALGVVLYELLTGKPPFYRDDTVSLLIEILQSPLVPPRVREPNAPPELSAVCEKALARSLDARYADAQGLAREVRAFMTGGRVRAYDYRFIELFKRWAAKHRAALAVATVSLGLLIALGVMSYANIVSERNRAVDAEGRATAAAVEAREAEGEARAARDGAEQLVHFMLGDLRERLEPLGQVALLNDVAGAVQRYYDGSQEAVASGGARGESASDASVLRARGKAKALALVGDIHRAQGALDKAQAAYQQAARIRKEAAGAAPDDVQLRAELADSDAQLGNVARARGDIADAAAHFSASLEARRALAMERPNDAEARLKLSQGHVNLGEVRALEGKLAEAEAAFADAIALREQLVEKDPKTPKWRYELAIALDRLGHAQFDRADFAAAQASYARAQKEREQIVQAAPGNLDWKHKLATSYQLMGDVALEQKATASAREAYDKAATMLAALTRSDPSNLRWVRDLVTAENRLGDVLMEAGVYADAYGAFEAALDRMRRLTLRDPSNREWQRDLAVGHNRTGDALKALGKHSEALEIYTAGLVIAEDLAERDPHNTQWQHDLALTALRVGQARAEMKARSAAAQALKRSEAILGRLVAKDPKNATWTHDQEVVKAALDGLVRAEVVTAEPKRQRQKRAVRPQRQRSKSKKPMLINF